MYEFYAHSEQGNYRNDNEDCFLINGLVSNNTFHKKITKFKNKNRDEFVVAIADGVGGISGGKFASNYILNELSKIKETDYIPLLIEKIKRTQKKLKIASINNNTPNAASTLTLLTSLNEYITIYHIGDTRAYKLTPTKLIQLTTDQTQLQKTIDELPFLKPIKKHLAKNNRLLGAIGISEKLDMLSIEKTSIEKNDLLLLTSDGIHDYLSKNEIIVILRKFKSSKTIVQRLITKAISNGSKDNLTAICIQFKN